MHGDFEAIREFECDNQRNIYYLIINSKETESEADRKELTEELIGEMILNIDKYKSIKQSYVIWQEIKNPPNVPHQHRIKVQKSE